MPETIITDEFGDDLSIRSYDSVSGYLYVESTEYDDNEPRTATIALTREQAAEAARALLEASGANVVPVESLKLASDVSFNEAVLRVACAHKRTVTFRYAKDKGQFIEARRLDPEKILGEDDKLAVLGTDPDREEAPRRFRLDRIKGEVSFA